MKIVELELPTDLPECYCLNTKDTERGEDMAVRWAKMLGAKKLYKIKQHGTMCLWKVEKA